MDRTEIIEALERGETGREIDAKIGYLFPESYIGDYGEPMVSVSVGPVSTSLDACIALVERVRPGWKHRDYTFDADDNKYRHQWVLHEDKHKAETSYSNGFSPASAAGALLAALLRATGGE